VDEHYKEWLAEPVTKMHIRRLKVDVERYRVHLLKVTRGSSDPEVRAAVQVYDSFRKELEHIEGKTK
jgi:hypothetical protein